MKAAERLFVQIMAHHERGSGRDRVLVLTLIPAPDHLSNANHGLEGLASAASRDDAPGRGSKSERETSSVGDRDATERSDNAPIPTRVKLRTVEESADVVNADLVWGTRGE